MGLVRSVKGALAASFILFAAGILSGCPTRDVGLALITNPAMLDFGSTTEVIQLTIRTNFSTTKPEPLTLRSSESWIGVNDCLDAAAGCLVGSISESITIPVRLDRSKTVLGANRGTITLDVPGASRLVLDVFADDRLDPDFSIPSRRVGVGQTINFSNLSNATPAAGAITGYLWNFGDGNTSTEASPIHVYSQPGVYAVSLTLTTTNGSETFTRENYVVVGDPQPTPDFTASPREVFSGASVQFSDLTTSNAGPITKRVWDFGDGSTSTALNPSHQYSQTGLFTVKLSVETEFSSAVEEKLGYILVKRKSAPEAIINISTVNPIVGDVIQFNDGSVPGSSPITSRVWRFGDGGVSTVQNPTYTYSRAGNFNVELTVISAHGSDTAVVPLSLDFAAPKADFEVLETNPSTCSDPVTCPEAVQFVDRTSPGSGRITQWLWNFGDGETSTEQNPRHGYDRVGTYSVSLTITTSAPQNNTATVTKRNLIVAVDPPRPDFVVNTNSVFTNTIVQFTNRTRVGTESAVTYNWDFDGNPITISDISTLPNPTYTYPAAGNFSPTLTATTATRAESKSKPLVVDGVTTADFAVSTRTPTTATLVQFTDKTSFGIKGTGGTVVADTYRWDFGDGSISALRNPTHTYDTVGVYPVSITVSYKHSGSGVEFTTSKTESAFVTVTLPDPPPADFNITNTGCLFLGENLNVAAITNPAIDTYQWDFGDPGSPGNTPGGTNASHIYAAPGVYTVTLTVTDSALQAPFNQSTKSVDVVVSDMTDLDQYVRDPEPRFDYETVGSPITLSLGLQTIGTATNLYMNSGLWRSATDIDVSDYDGISWKHNVTIIEPNNRQHDTGILLVTGGSRFDDPPSASDLSGLNAPELAIATGAPIVILDDVPAQPIAFVGDTEGERTEDEIIAYSFDKYLDDNDANRALYPTAEDPWPVLHVMARAAVRAMDVAQDVSTAQGDPIEDFIVTGASKRGWTTWLTGITDCRVKAIAPVVIDLLNTRESMIHHQRSLANQPNGTTGGFSDAVIDYTNFDIFSRLADPDDESARELLTLVDPYEYRERVIIPKLLLNASGDEFFLTDSAQFYIDDLVGETNISYMPNVGHGLGDDPFNITDTSSALYILTSWILGILQDVERPAINWAFPNDNTIVVNLDDPSGENPEVRLWSINNPIYRDFRNFVTEALEINWTSQVLTRQPNGTYVANVPDPATGWTAYYIQVRFDSDAELAVENTGLPQPEFVFSTPVRVVPNEYPQP
jgi:PKD repeat protein